MKKTFLVPVLCLVLVSAGFSMGFSLKLKGGMAYVTGGDYNKAIDGINAYSDAFYSTVTGTFSKLSLGMDVGGELILDVNESFGIGIGVGYISLSKDAEKSTGTWSFLGFPMTDTDTITPSVSAIPITLNIYYKVPMGGMNLNFFAGAGLYLSKVKIDRVRTSTFLALGTDITFDASKTAFGFQGGIGLDIPVSGNISFIIDVTGRYVRLSDIMGDYTLVPTVLGITGATETGTDYYIWTYDYTSGGTAYHMFSLGKTGPSGTAYSSVQHGTFDFTGVNGQAGFKISF
jgi:opacity protein-like surface antigen